MCKHAAGALFSSVTNITLSIPHRVLVLHIMKREALAIANLLQEQGMNYNIVELLANK